MGQKVRDCTFDGEIWYQYATELYNLELDKNNNLFLEYNILHFQTDQ